MHTTTHHRSRLRLRITSLAALSALAITAAGCGSDAKDAAPSTSSASGAAATVAPTASPSLAETTPPSTADTTDTTDTTAMTAMTDTTDTNGTAATAGTTAGSDPAEIDLAAFCSAEVDLEMASAALGDPSVDPAGGAAAVLPAAERAAELAPAELEDVFAAGLDALHRTANGGDGSALESFDPSPIQNYAAEHCAWNHVAVTMASYHYTGLPDTLPAGEYDFNATNESPEPHLLILVKKRDGVSASWDELLSSPDGESQVVTVAAAFAPTGATSHAITHLEPGEYLAVCPIAQGSTATSEGSGPPHFTLGMRQVLTVTAAG